jgi:hypothetical protein
MFDDFRQTFFILCGKSCNLKLFLSITHPIQKHKPLHFVIATSTREELHQNSEVNRICKSQHK